jgi:hypothetical protein
VRKARDLFWTVIGVTLMVRRGLSLKNLDKVNEGERTSAEGTIATAD